MSSQQRIWHIGTVFTLLLLLLSCRLLYWQLINRAAPRPDTLTQDSIVSTTATPTPVETGGPPVSTILTSTPKPDQRPGATSKPSPSPTKMPTATPTPVIIRGNIHDRNGRRLAYDIADGSGNFSRFYTEPSLAHVVGYVSGLRVGVTGIEQSYNDTLGGLDNSAGPAGHPLQGNDIYLTIDSRVQRAAALAIEGKAGAVVVIDAETGALLAMASSPTFDPNKILEPNYVQSLENCNDTDNCQQTLFNRAAQGWYTPGSTWKTVALIAALDTKQVTLDTEFDFGTPLKDEKGNIYYIYTVDGFSIQDPNHREQQLDLTRSYAVSANAAFARIGDEMPAEVMIQYAARFGFGQDSNDAPSIEINASAARLAINPQTLYTNNLLRASTAIGQGELQASPLSVALVTMAVVNDGHIPNPHLIQAIKSPSGDLLAGEKRDYWIKDTMQKETARYVYEMMQTVVRSGSGRRANVPGLIVGGKTGTAQVGADLPPHAWFTGFVQSDDQIIVITVIVENGGQGSQVAAPLFAQIADVAMHHLGEAVEEIVPEPTGP